MSWLDDNTNNKLMLMNAEATVRGKVYIVEFSRLAEEIRRVYEKETGIMLISENQSRIGIVTDEENAIICKAVEDKINSLDEPLPCDMDCSLI